MYCRIVHRLHISAVHRLYSSAGCRLYNSAVRPDLSERIRARVVTSSPSLTAANHYYLEGGKLLRPAIVLQLAQALHPAGPLSAHNHLAEIVEMIHAASLLHDDVVDDAELRRGKATANVKFGSKSAVLSGDYLLAQASVALAELGDLRVIILLATVIKDLVEGEMLQMKATVEEKLSIEVYLRKSYLKTASLIAKSCKAVAILGGHNETVQEACYQFGRHLGLAFQIVDDKLDYTSTHTELGKPVGADLRNGIVTAPVLFAMEEFPVIRDYVGRGFSQNNDHEKVIEMVLESNGVARTQELAEDLLSKSMHALSFLPSDVTSQSFNDLISSVTLRTK
ncbi:Solanesyl diphosphate synthase [Paramicrosporidium saccamoebae]|uniref:Solanesyl diphosphate synthase n=1 Tax=Paramicrosporidium saccamoebae TaxID=1246581 RepID=A0A2H9TMA8_9FUNG|nr:Solanesyl diphosphate synthase [Paramicrosporidium saccamoebae]